MLYELSKCDGYAALKRASAERKGWRYNDVRNLLYIEDKEEWSYGTFSHFVVEYYILVSFSFELKL